MKHLFLAWQDPGGRSWFPIGRLSINRSRYLFVYTKGAEMAQRESGFRPLASFPSLREAYESDELFAMFANRLPSRSRPEYEHFVGWLHTEDKDDDIALLARSGGRRQTDAFEMFPCPEPDEDGLYHFQFFAHGLRHLSPDSIKRIEALRTGEQLLLMQDFQNHYDPSALVLRTNDTNETFPGDRYFVGFMPRYLQEDLYQVLQDCVEAPMVSVERINQPPAPLQFRLLCSLTSCWPEQFRPCAGESFEPIVGSISTS